MTKRSYIVLVLAFISLTTYSQINEATYAYLKSNIPKEKVQLQVSVNVLLPGEFLYYKTYNLNFNNSGLSDVSKVNYIELVGNNENIIFKHKLHVKNSTSQGDYFIPTTIQTGHYKLIAYSHWSLNNSEHRFSEKDIYIINPYTTVSTLQPSQKEIAIEISKTDSLNKLDANSSGISITTDKNKYSSREKVIVSIKNNLANFENVLISIRKLDSISVEQNKHQSSGDNKNQHYYLPELRGEIISGKIEAKNNTNSIANKVLSLSIPGKDFTFKNATTDSNGQFFFILNEDYSSSNVIIQLDDENAFNYTIKIDELGFNAYSQLDFKPITLNASIKDWLKQQSINNQIENAYLNVKADSIISKDKVDLFFHPKAVHYKLDDFNRFKTIKETFIEVIFASALVERNGHSEFVVYDYENQEANNILGDVNPLVLVDGVLITNNENIINYNAYNIDTISIVVGHYIYGSKIYNGVISFKTINKDFLITHNEDYIKHIQLDQYQNDKVYHKSNYNKNALNRIPDYKAQLLWLPNLNLGKTETVDLYTSDVKGTFEIVLEGYTKSGKHIKTTTYFEVNN